jgi:hypothetical protein
MDAAGEGSLLENKDRELYGKSIRLKPRSSGPDFSLWISLQELWRGALAKIIWNPTG